MDPRDGTRPEEDTEAEQIRAIVPPRAVLTELARGFLLANGSDPKQAVRFAETFLKERSGGWDARPSVVPPPVTRAQRALGRHPQGAIEPSGNGPPL